MSARVFWPAALGVCVLAARLWMQRRDLFDSGLPVESRIRALGPVFIGAAIATFSGEHFTDAADLVRLVPQWLPLRIPITYLVGVALLAAGLSLAGRVAVRWSAPLLALLFGLFVLLIHLPNAVEHARTRIFWIFPFREGTFAVGAFSVFVSETRPSWARRSGGFSLFVRLWTAFVLVFFGVQHLGYPQFAPGVPSPRPTSSWVPLPHVVAYVTGAILVALGAAGLVKRRPSQQSLRRDPDGRAYSPALCARLVLGAWPRAADHGDQFRGRHAAVFRLSAGYSMCGAGDDLKRQ